MGRIVVVDDNQLNLKRCEMLLQPLGHEILTFTGAEPALQFLKNHPCHLALVDLAMPIHSGYDLMAALTAAKIEIKVIVVSGKNKNDDIKKAVQMGASDYILKPYDDDFFVAKVKQALQSEEIRLESHFATALYDKPGFLKVKMDQISISETGFYFTSQFPLPKGLPIEFTVQCFDEMKLNNVQFKVANCIEHKIGTQTKYKISVSFVGLSQAQLTEVRLWVRQQHIKFKKS